MTGCLTKNKQVPDKKTASMKKDFREQVCRKCGYVYEEEADNYYCYYCKMNCRLVLRSECPYNDEYYE